MCLSDSPLLCSLDHLPLNHSNHGHLTTLNSVKMTSRNLRDMDIGLDIDLDIGKLHTRYISGTKIIVSS
jgi:hypothetical protein